MNNRVTTHLNFEYGEYDDKLWDNDAKKDVYNKWDPTAARSAKNFNPFETYKGNSCDASGVYPGEVSLDVTFLNKYTSCFRSGYYTPSFYIHRLSPTHHQIPPPLFPHYYRTVTRIPSVVMFLSLSCLRRRLRPKRGRPTPRPELMLAVPDVRTKYVYNLKFSPRYRAESRSLSVSR